MLIRIGAYIKGSDRELDEALSKKEQMEAFLTQDSTAINDFQETIDSMIMLMGS